MTVENLPATLRFYFISDDQVPQPTPYEQVNIAIKAGATIIQYRRKRFDLRFFEEALAIRRLCQANTVPFVVNDHVLLALALDADGVHLGQEDEDPALVRRILGQRAIIGISVSNLHELAHTGDASTLNAVYTQAKNLARHGLMVRFQAPPSEAADCALDALAAVRRDPSPENLERLLKLLETVRRLDLHDAFFHMQNGLSGLFSEIMAAPETWTDRTEKIKELYGASGIIIERFSAAINGLEPARGTSRKP